MSDIQEQREAKAIEFLHTDTTGVQGLNVPNDKPWLNSVDSVNGIVQAFVSETLRKFAMTGDSMTVEEFKSLIISESGRLNFLFLGFGEGPDINFTRGIWNTPGELGKFVRVAEAMDGDWRSAVGDMFISLAADVITTFEQHHSDPIEDWGWKLDALIEGVASTLLGLPCSDLELIAASADD
jgi:hypothetical protein